MGYNNVGQLGDGSLTYRYTPVVVEQMQGDAVDLSTAANSGERALLLIGARAFQTRSWLSFLSRSPPSSRPSHRPVLFCDLMWRIAQLVRR